MISDLVLAYLPHIWYAKSKSEIIKHYEKEHIFVFLLNCKSRDFKPLLENANPTLIDSFFFI